jgi:molybdate transport system ATP-binding protein
MLTVDVKKNFTDFSVVAKFQTEQGVTALFGPSGAGKTTVANMIAGLVTPDSGQIRLDDATLYDSMKRIDMAVHRRRIGYVFQEGRLFPHLTIAQNIDYGCWISGLPRDERERDRIVALLNIAPLLTRRPGKLSGGERQRVAIARALLMQPQLLLLDEPLASLDTARKAEILPYLSRLRDDVNIPMIYVSHYADEIRKIATSVVCLEGGRVVAIGGSELLK